MGNSNHSIARKPKKILIGKEYEHTSQEKANKQVYEKALKISIY
jgi:hypothetical protein